jgi:hypothetical protein
MAIQLHVTCAKCDSKLRFLPVQHTPARLSFWARMKHEIKPILTGLSLLDGFGGDWSLVETSEGEWILIVDEVPSLWMTIRDCQIHEMLPNYHLSNPFTWRNWSVQPSSCQLFEWRWKIWDFLNGESCLSRSWGWWLSIEKVRSSSFHSKSCHMISEE